MNMKKTVSFKSAGIELFHIISEPGDVTLYDYFVYRDGPDNFCFMPGRSTFRFPQRLNYYDTLGVDLNKVAEELDCNFHTLLECVKTMEEMHNEKM